MEIIHQLNNKQRLVFRMSDYNSITLVHQYFYDATGWRDSERNHFAFNEIDVIIHNLQRLQKLSVLA